MKIKSIFLSVIATSIVSLFISTRPVFSQESKTAKARTVANDLNSLPIEVQDYLSKQNMIVSQTEPVGYFFIPESDLEVLYDKNKVNLEASGLTYTFSNKRYIKFFTFYINKAVMESLQSKYTYIDEKTTTYYALKMNSKNQIIWKTNEDMVKPRLISTEIQDADISVKLVRGRNLGLHFKVKLINN